MYFCYLHTKNHLILSCFVLSLVEIGPVVLEKIIFKFCYCIFAISLLFPLEKGQGALQLKKLEFFLPKDALCLVWVNLAQWLWRNTWKWEKFMTMTMTTTDNRQIVITKAHLCLRLRWTKKDICKPTYTCTCTCILWYNVVMDFIQISTLIKKIVSLFKLTLT